MSTGSEHSGGPGGRQPTEDELRAEYEAQIKKIRVEHVLLEHVVTVANLGLRRTGLAPGTENERDTEQVRIAIESIRSLLPLLEQSMPEQAAQIKDALAQLQFAYVKIGGTEATPGEPQPGEPSQPAAEPPAAEQPAGEPRTGEPAPEPERPGSEEPGPAQRSGRLWVPGQ